MIMLTRSSARIFNLIRYISYHFSHSSIRHRKCFEFTTGVMLLRGFQTAAHNLSLISKRENIQEKDLPNPKVHWETFEKRKQEYSDVTFYWYRKLTPEYSTTAIFTVMAPRWWNCTITTRNWITFQNFGHLCQPQRKTLCAVCDNNTGKWIIVFVGSQSE